MGGTHLTDRRAERAGRNRPVVVVRYQLDPRNARPLWEIGAGLEEEGVPFRTEDGAEGSAAALAYAAAQASPLGVGVGVSAEGNVCVHHAKLPPNAPALVGPPQTARTMGHNAARLVTGIPLKNAPTVFPSSAHI
jgi:hypothetical protein